MAGDRAVTASSPIAGTVAVVTGASGGIGSACAAALASAGAQTVVIHYAGNLAGASRTEEEVARRGAVPLVVQADLSTEEGSVGLIAEALRAAGGVDILVNSAGATRAVPRDRLDLVEAEDWTNAFTVNLMAPFWCIRAAADSLATRRGSVVTIGTASAERAAGSSVPYSVSKAAVVQLMRVLAVSLAPEVRVNTVSPGAIDTDWLPRVLGEEEARAQHRAEISRIPLQRIAGPEDVAAAVVGILGAQYVTGQNLVVDGGRAVLY